MTESWGRGLSAGCAALCTIVAGYIATRTHGTAAVLWWCLVGLLVLGIVLFLGFARTKPAAALPAPPVTEAASSAMFSGRFKDVTARNSTSDADFIVHGEADNVVAENVLQQRRRPGAIDETGTG